MKHAENAGYTLVELIVVIAMLAVAVGVGGYSLSLITRNRAKSCADSMVSAIENTRTNAMAKGGGTVTFSVDADGKICMQQSIGPSGSPSVGDVKEIGSGVTVTYQITPSAGTASVYTLGEDDGSGTARTLVLGFSASSGSFVGTQYADWIQVSGGGKTVTITCYKLTGKVEMN